MRVFQNIRNILPKAWTTATPKSWRPARRYEPAFQACRCYLASAVIVRYHFIRHRARQLSRVASDSLRLRRKRNDRTSVFDLIPAEILLHIARFMNPEDCVLLGLTCHRLYETLRQHMNFALSGAEDAWARDRLVHLLEKDLIDYVVCSDCHKLIYWRVPQLSHVESIHDCPAPIGARRYGHLFDPQFDQTPQHEFFYYARRLLSTASEQQRAWRHSRAMVVKTSRSIEHTAALPTGPHAFSYSWASLTFKEIQTRKKFSQSIACCPILEADLCDSMLSNNFYAVPEDSPLANGLNYDLVILRCIRCACDYRILIVPEACSNSHAPHRDPVKVSVPVWSNRDPVKASVTVWRNRVSRPGRLTLKVRKSSHGHSGPWFSVADRYGFGMLTY